MAHGVFFRLVSGLGQFSGGTTTHQMALGLPTPPKRAHLSMYASGMVMSSLRMLWGSRFRVLAIVPTSMPSEFSLSSSRIDRVANVLIARACWVKV